MSQEQKLPETILEHVSVLDQAIDAAVIKGGVYNKHNILLIQNSLNVLLQYIQATEKQKQENTFKGVLHNESKGDA